MRGYCSGFKSIGSTLTSIEPAGRPSPLAVPRGVWKPLAYSISRQQSTRLWTGPPGDLWDGPSLRQASLRNSSQGRWGSPPCPVGSHGEEQEAALPRITEGAEAPAMLELPLTTYSVPQWQHSLGGKTFFWAMVGAEET